MPQETKAKNSVLHHGAVQGAIADASDMAVLREAINHAVDYRGDVTISRRSTGDSLHCFIFDQKQSDDPQLHLVRAMPKDDDARVSIPLAEIQSIEFTGKDTAAGRSFDTWMKKYVEKKLAGEKASIESEPLEE